jgi:hypothetical protein
LSRLPGVDQLYLPRTALFSIDFGTVSLEDLEDGRGARNLDSRCTGTSLRDFRRGVDQEQLPMSVIAAYDSGDPVDDGLLVFTPDVLDQPKAPSPASMSA